MPIPVDQDHPHHSPNDQDPELNGASVFRRTKKTRGEARGAARSETSSEPRPAGSPTKRRRSISGKVKKIKPREGSNPPKSFGKRSSPKTKRR
jgi:hypothetical protein